MKKSLLVLFSVFFVFGCVRVQNIMTNYKLDESKKCFVGERIVIVVNGTSPKIGQDTWYKGSIMEELVYSGIDGKTIKVTYRQYVVQNSNFLIKDGFTQHLEYDLTEKKEIRYKSILIEVLEATSSEIKYIVKEGPKGN